MSCLYFVVIERYVIMNYLVYGIICDYLEMVFVFKCRLLGNKVVLIVCYISIEDKREEWVRGLGWLFLLK